MPAPLITTATELPSYQAALTHPTQGLATITAHPVRVGAGVRPVPGCWPYLLTDRTYARHGKNFILHGRSTTTTDQDDAWPLFAELVDSYRAVGWTTAPRTLGRT